MAKIKLEKDTKDVLDKQKVLHDWVASEGYQSFKKIVMQEVVNYTSLLRIQPIANATNEALVTEYKAQSRLGALLLDCLKRIEGDAYSYKDNLDMLMKSEEDSLMIYFPERSETEIK